MFSAYLNCLFPGRQESWQQMCPLLYVQLTRLPNIILHAKLLTPFPVAHVPIDWSIHHSIFFLITEMQIGVILLPLAHKSRQGPQWRYYRSPCDIETRPLHQASEDLNSDPVRILICYMSWKGTASPSGLWATQLVNKFVSSDISGI